MRFVLIALTMAGLGGWLLGARVAEAKHQPILPGVPTRVMLRAIDRGYVTYALDRDTAAYPGFRAQAGQIAAAGFTAFGLEAREITAAGSAALKPDIWLTMPDDQTFVAICSEAAAACVTYTNDPIIEYYRRALLYADWKSAISHEGLNYGHTMGEGEQYFDEGELRCDLNAKYTVMSCGTGVWEPQPFDISILRLNLLPRKAGYVGGGRHPDGTRFVFYCDADLVHTTRVALLAYTTATGAYEWTGVNIPLAKGCNGWNVAATPGVCYWLSFENGFNYRRWETRQEAEALCV